MDEAFFSCDLFAKTFSRHLRKKRSALLVIEEGEKYLLPFCCQWKIV